MNSCRAAFSTLLGLTFAAAAPRAAHADAPAPAESAASPEATSKALFQEARQLAADGSYERACPKFEEALRLHVGIGIQFNLADCWEHLGRTASASALFNGVAASAHAAGQGEREGLARARARALEPRLVHLSLEVAGNPAELSVRTNHELLERSAYGSQRAVDPGKYLIEASAPGKKAWTTEVEVGDKDVTVSVPALEPESAAPPAAAKLADKSAVACLPKEQPSAPKAMRSVLELRANHHMEYVLPLLAVGVSTAAAGTVLAIKYGSANDFARHVCPASVGCSEADIEDHAHAVDDAKMFRTWSLVGYGVSGAAFVGAAVLYLNPSLTRERRREGERAWSAEPFVGRDGSWGVSAQGRF